MLKRIAAALVLCVALAACDQTPNPGKNFFTGNTGVTVLDAKWVPTGEGSQTTSGGMTGWVLAHITYTNTTDTTFVPDISHFFMMDTTGQRYQAHDQGSMVFTGVSNDMSPLKKGDKREYTIGFRSTDPNVAGTIFYDLGY